MTGTVILIGLVLVAAIAGTVLQNARRKQLHIQTIIPSHRNADIIGDGAWTSTQSQYPKSARVRDMGMQTPLSGFSNEIERDAARGM